MKGALALLALVAAPAAAEELTPFDEAMKTASYAYPFARCAGFYDAIIARSSEAEFGAEGWAMLNTTSEEMILAAALMAGNDDAALDMAAGLAAAYRSAEDWQAQYSARFAENYEASGEIIAGDALLEADLGFCAELRLLAADLGNAE
ncbi:hypothetical protein [Pseudoroseicyclus sp. CXY001]|uniref:hypothetical protein n=1 Tax=Pseudoroseicyclus sp. CXY001 TaxID=3242492 RepID=UPI00358DC2EE